MAENADRVLHFNEYFRIIRNRFWVIFTIFVLTVLSGAYVTEEVIQKAYTASVQIQVHHEGELAARNIDGGNTDLGFDPTTFQADLEIMQSPEVLMPVIHDLDLDKAWAKRIFKSNMDQLPQTQAMDYMTNKVLRLDSKRGTNIIEITATSDVAQEAADIANGVAKQYKTMSDAKEEEKNGRGAESLRDQMTQQQKVVDEKEAAVEKLRQQAGNVGVDISEIDRGESERAEEDLVARKKDLLTAKEDYDGRRVLLAQLQGLSDDEFVNTLSAMNHSEANIATLRAETFKLESEIDDLLKDGFEENHPRVLALKAEVTRHQEQIKDLIAGTRRAMELDTEVAKSRIDLLQKEVDDLSARILADQSTQLEPFRQAKLELEQQQGILEAFNIRLKAVLAERQLLESPITIISKAETPDHPSKPNKNLNLAISAAAGLFLGIAVAFLIEYLDTSVKTMADAESLLGLSVLTVIPNKGGPLPLTVESARLPHAEGYRILRAKLDLKVQNGMGPSLSMLSGGPGEGKSTTLYNLAVICAQSGQSVVLVDCDLRRPTLHDLVHLPNDRGVANFLRAEGDAVEYIQQTAIPNLHLLASGDMPLSEIGTLAGDKVRVMLEELKQRYDLVLIDSPPILGISDGSIIAREVDYVILVVQHRRYPREISVRAKRAIEEVHGNCVGMVLNSVAIQSDDSYYYYSNYGNYYKKADRTKKRKNTPKATANGKSLAAASTRQKDLESDEF